MRLRDSTRFLIDVVKVHLTLEEDNLWDSTCDIEYNQIIWIDNLITSDYLIDTIYNEINEE